MKYRLFRSVIALIGALALLVGYRKGSESEDR